MKKIIIGADHAGFKTKEFIKKHLVKKGYLVVDVGALSYNARDDYPDFAKKATKKVLSDDALGVVVCGTGAGICMAANKVPGIRAVQIYDAKGARLAREHNHANVVALRGQGLAMSKALSYVLTFLRAKPDTNARHMRRLRKVKAMEQ